MSSKMEPPQVAYSEVDYASTRAPSITDSTAPMNAGSSSQYGFRPGVASGAVKKNEIDFRRDYTKWERMTMHRPTWQGTPAPAHIVALPVLAPKWIKKQYKEFRNPPTEEELQERHLAKRREIDERIARGKARLAEQERLQQAGGDGASTA